MPNGEYLTDGAMDFSRGVDSGKVKLLQGPSNPNGLRRDQLAWLTNGTVRGGGITQRGGWKFLTALTEDDSVLYQGGFLYEPLFADPYFVFQIGGRIYRVAATEDAVPFDLSTPSGLTNPANVERAYFEQGDIFLVIQAGDFGQAVIPTLPLFYDGHTMWRSRGITGDADPTHPLTNNEIPAALSMDYYAQRFWYAQGRIVSAADICGGPSGTVTYNRRDSILHVTENPLAAGGDGFNVPINSGPVRALQHAASLDTALGQGPLYIFTAKDIFSLEVPYTRTDWAAADSDNQPRQRVAQLKYGTGADRSVVPVNGDLFYQSFEPAIRPLSLAVRFANQWANTQISRNINRALLQNDRSLLRFGSGMLFDNRLYQTCLPYETPVGTAHKAVALLDFDLVSSLQDTLEGAPIPAWEGIGEGLNILQLFSGEFGGLERAFATVYSDNNERIELWELTGAERFENGDENRVEWWFETPSYPFGDPFRFKEIHGCDLWIDRLYGTVDFTVEYRMDDDPCWHFWVQFQQCTARNSCERLEEPVCEPTTEYREANRKPLSFPHPPPKECAGNGRGVAYKGYSVQLRFRIRGFCRVRGFILKAMPVMEPAYPQLVCAQPRSTRPVPVPPTPTTPDERITEDGYPAEVRITEDGDIRITED